MQKDTFANNTIILICLLFYQLSGNALKRGHIIAYQGLNQPTDYLELEDNGCTAYRIKWKQHDYIENTFPAFDTAIANGADILHFNIHNTTDNEFVVFHDWTLECRTNGTGITSEKEYDYLQKLDIGYGYQIQGTNEHPFRGKGIGLMPTLDTVISRHPKTQLLINMKTDQPAAVNNLIAYIQNLSEKKRSLLSFIGSDSVVSPVRNMFPKTRIISKW